MEYDRNVVSPMFARRFTTGGRGLPMIGGIDQIPDSPEREHRLASGNVSVLVGRLVTRANRLEKLVSLGATQEQLERAVDLLVDDAAPLGEQLLHEYSRMRESAREVS